MAYKFPPPVVLLTVLTVVGLFLIPQVSAGYASASYSAVTVCSNNTLTADYFTLGLYSYDDYAQHPYESVEFDQDDFTPCGGSFASGSIEYTQNGAVKTIVANNYALTPSNLYFVVIYSGVIPGWSYSLSFDFEFRDGNDTVSGVTGYLVHDDEVIDDDTVFSPNVAYRVQFSANFPAVSFSENSITCSVIFQGIRATASAIRGTYCVTEACSMTLIEDSPVMDQVDITPGAGVSGTVNKTESTVSGRPTVNISNSTNTYGGVADSDGNVNLSISIPANTPFLVRIWNKESYNVTTHVEIGNVIINGQTGSHTYNRNLTAGFATFLCHYVDSYGSHQWYRSSLSQIIDNNGWYYSSSGTVTIEIEAHYDDGSGTKTAQNVFLDIVFKDTPTP